ncbi:asparagine--tRNA ligase [Buchnera aphidicola]|uniref:asparagine--tRNA ligase n=1 Tax=Buchnera aphidicola TaxID=9 RepID=UPI00094DBF2C|nr:asparagine--tRNA ligase [Buchnera aphidicola]
MKTASIFDIYTKNNYVNKLVTINGWVRSKRTSKIGISFLTIYDGSSAHTIQVVAKKSLLQNFTEITKLTAGCSISVEGQLLLSYGNFQIYEINAHNIEVLGWVDRPELYPISAKKHTVEYMRNFLHLRPRTRLISVVSRIRNTVFYSLNQFLQNHNYLWVSSPIITSIDAEGAGSMFKVSLLDTSNHLHGENKGAKKIDFFGKKVFLTVSGQLTLEAYACALSKVYSLGPTFRAENSNTKKHLSEFWMLEVEKAFADIDQISSFSEKLLKYVISYVLDNCLPDLIFLQKTINVNLISRLNKFLCMKFIQIEYTEVVNIIKKNGNIIQDNISWGEDLSAQQEKYLIHDYFKSPIVIRNYPKLLKAFYMRLNSDNQTVSAFDVLIPRVGEIIGGSEREDRMNYLDARMREVKLHREKYNWYRDLRRYGTVPHAGFGLGVERLILFITGVKNIRESIPYPRTIGKSDC